MPSVTTPPNAPDAAQPPAESSGGESPTYHPLLALETILEHSKLNITIFDADYVVRDVSRAAAALASMSREEMCGRSLLNDLPPQYHHNLARTLAGESVDEQGKLAPEVSAEEPWTHVTTLPVRAATGAICGGMIFVEDVSEQVHAGELVEKLAFLDPVTELPNRTMLSMVLTRALSGAKGGQRQLALVWLNLDRFKDVNDALGQRAGDELLRAVGERLYEHVRTNDMVARLGADDFVLLLPRINSRPHLSRLMARIAEVFAVPFTVGEEEILLSASCGIALHPDGSADERELQEQAHTAMRTAKELGGGAYQIFDSGAAEGSPRLWLAREIRDGIAQGDFALHYPASHRPAHDARAVSRGAGALAASQARPGAAAGVHPLRRGEWPDRQSGAPSAREGLRSAQRMAGLLGVSSSPGAQHLGP